MEQAPQCGCADRRVAPTALTWLSHRQAPGDLSILRFLLLSCRHHRSTHAHLQSSERESTVPIGPSVSSSSPQVSRYNDSNGAPAHVRISTAKLEWNLFPLSGEISRYNALYWWYLLVTTLMSASSVFFLLVWFFVMKSHQLKGLLMLLCVYY